MHRNENEDKPTKPESALLSTLKEKAKDPENRVFIDWFFWKYTEDSKQLSDQGIALLSQIHAEKENCNCQPLFCEGRSARIHVKNELLKTPIGTEVVLIYDNINVNEERQISRKSHRYAIKLIHTPKGILDIEVNSTTDFISISDENEQNIFLGERQKDSFSCGAYATKDANKLLKTYGIEGLKNSLDEFKKSDQLNPKQVFEGEKKWEKQHRKHLKIATREEKNMNINDYTRNFAKKQCEQVLEWLEQHTKEEAIAAVQKFDALSITSHDLATRHVERQEKYPEIFSRKVHSHIQKGKNPNRFNILGETLLHEAVRLKDYISVQSLLKAGANPLLLDQEKQPILAWQDLDPKLIDLIKNYSDPKNPNLPDSQSGILPLMKTLLDLKDMQTLDLEEKAEKTLNEIQNMIKMGANPYLPDDSQNGKSPLMQAVCNVDLPIEIIAKLAGEGKNKLNRVDYKGWTPLHWAVSHGNIEAAKYLLKNGADPNLQSQDGKTPLSLVATSFGDKILKDDIIHLLLTSGANSFIMKHVLITYTGKKISTPKLRLVCIFPPKDEDDKQFQEELCDIANKYNYLSSMQSAVTHIYTETLLEKENNYLLREEFFLLANFWEKLETQQSLEEEDPLRDSLLYTIEKSFQSLTMPSPSRRPFQAIFDLLTSDKIDEQTKRKVMQAFSISNSPIQSCLNSAVTQNRLNVVRLLLDHLNIQPDIYQDAMIKALQSNNPDMFREFIRRPHQYEFLNLIGKLIKENNINIISLLIKSECPVNKIQIQHAIQMATRAGSTEIAKCLQEKLDKMTELLTQTPHNLFQPNKTAPLHENENKDELQPKSK